MGKKLHTQFTDNKLIQLYHSLLLPRLIEEKMLKLLRQNRISKWFSGIGQEAISVGVSQAIQKHDFILPMHRNLGIFTGRNLDLYILFSQLFGKEDGYTKGIERSFHFGTFNHNIVGMISHLAANLPVADGLALSAKLRREDRIAVAFCGDGATSEGDFHEAVNLAAVWNLPVLFLIENNGYGLSTPVSQQFACKNLSDRALGYGIHGYTIDGNNVLEVYKTVQNAREEIVTKGKPIIIEAMTFRMRGHEEASGTAYVPKELMAEWAKKDPILKFESFLKSKNLLDDSKISEIHKSVNDSFKEPLNRALNAESISNINHIALEDLVFKPFEIQIESSNGSHTSKRFVDAIKDGLNSALEQDKSVVIMGQDIADYGGVFKVTEGFLEKFGSERIRNTPIIESAALGAAYGLALAGFKPVIEMQFSDFISCGFNQIINNIAKSHFRWSDGINITIRSPHGAGVGAGPFHSQSPEGWFMQQPGLKVLVPATVQDAQDMIFTAIQDPNPVLIFEHKKLYRSLKSDVSSLPLLTDYHKANVIKSGTDISLITYGFGVNYMLNEIENLESSLNCSIEIIDLRCLWPLDEETILNSVKKTGKAVLFQEANDQLGPLSQIAAILSEKAFEWLDAPIFRCSALNSPVPTNLILENKYLPYNRIAKIIEKALSY